MNSNILTVLLSECDNLRIVTIFAVSQKENSFFTALNIEFLNQLQWGQNLGSAVISFKPTDPIDNFVLRLFVIFPNDTSLI